MKLRRLYLRLIGKYTNSCVVTITPVSTAVQHHKQIKEYPTSLTVAAELNSQSIQAWSMRVSVSQHKGWLYAERRKKATSFVIWLFDNTSYMSCRNLFDETFGYVPEGLYVKEIYKLYKPKEDGTDTNMEESCEEKVTTA